MNKTLEYTYADDIAVTTVSVSYRKVGNRVSYFQVEDNGSSYQTTMSIEEARQRLKTQIQAGFKEIK